MIASWIAEIIPMPVTSLTPLMLFPLFGIASIQNVSTSYADPIIFLFMGGFFLAIAIEKWNLHKRIALHIINFCGYQSSRILLGFMLSTFFISMWISNTATTLMMYPIALSIIHFLNVKNSDTRNNNLSIALLLSIAYASNIGGLSTIIGTPPNSAFVAFAKDQYDIQISFINWMLLCTPISFILLIILFLLFNYILFPFKFEKSEESKIFLKSQLKNLGAWSAGEKRVLLIFILMATLWITKDLIVKITSLNISDTSIALLGTFLLFILPSDKSKVIREFDIDETVPRTGRLLNWEDTHKMSWGILLMFGGGLALAKQLENCGLLDSLGKSLSQFAPDNLFLLILLVSTISIFLSEIMSNIAQVIVLSPVICSISVSMGLSPLILGIPMCLAASCASMLPMGTPPNAIVYGSGKIPLIKMLNAGLILNIVSILIISLFCYIFTTIIF